MVSTAALLATCDAAVARLHEEKLALVEAVLQLKIQERAYWQAALAREQAFDAPAPPSLAPGAVETRERERKIREYQERIAAADTSEQELRVMLDDCRRRLKRSAPATESDGAEDLARILERVKIGESGVPRGRATSLNLDVSLHAI